MTPEQLAQRLANQPNNDRGDMLKATGVKPLPIERFINNGEEYPLDAETADLVGAWFRGEFGQTMHGWTRVNPRAGEPVCLGVKADLEIPTADHTVGQGATGVTLMRDALLGKDTKEPDELKLAAMRKVEVEEDQRRKRAKGGVGAAVMSLGQAMTGNRLG